MGVSVRARFRRPVLRGAAIWALPALLVASLVAITMAGAAHASSAGTNSGGFAMDDSSSVVSYRSATAAVCTAATVTPDKASPQQSGTIITFTAAATGCLAPEFLYYFQAAGGPWILGRGYGSSKFVWNTAGNGATSYTVDVWAREKGSSASQQAFKVITYLLSSPAACTITGFSASPSSPQPVGTMVTFTASASGCSQPTYLFWVKAASGGSWILARGYTTNSTYAWRNTGDGKTTYTWVVWIRQNGSKFSRETQTTVTYQLT